MLPRINIQACLSGLLAITMVVATVPLLPAPPVAEGAFVLPNLPTVYLDTTYTPPTGATIAVQAGGDFQGALNAAQPGDVITLAAGATFTGPFTLPNKAGSGWIIVRSSAPDGALPSPGTRINPSYASVMPKIVVGPGSSAIKTATGAHHFRFIGIEFSPTPGAWLYDVIELGTADSGPPETTVTALPYSIIFDRCYIHGDPVVGSRRGIAMNSASTAVIDSYLSDFKDVPNDNSAIGGWNGPGPYKIVNNYLSAAGVTVFFGGTDPSIPNLVPSDIEVRGNYFFKSLSWRLGDPAYAGTLWRVKNHFELKNAQRVLVDGNIFENNWPQADQHGFGIVFTPRNQGGGCPWCVVQDVTFTHNIVRHSTAGVALMGMDDINSSQQLKRLLIQNNLLTDIGAFSGCSNRCDRAGRLFEITDSATANLVIDHNTAHQTQIESPLVAGLMNGTLVPNTGFVFTNNIALNGTGVWGDNLFGSPLSTLNTYFPGYVFHKNVLWGSNPSRYPPDNFSPATVAFVNYAGGDYHLAANSPYKNAGTDGKDIGADVDALKGANETPPVTGSTR